MPHADGFRIECEQIGMSEDCDHHILIDHIDKDEAIKLWNCRLKEQELMKTGWRLSAYAATINWDGSRNRKGWLRGLHELIIKYQQDYTEMFGEGSGMQGRTPTWLCNPATQEEIEE